MDRLPQKDNEKSKRNLFYFVKQFSDLIIVNFTSLGGKAQIFYQAIFRIMTILRTKYNIGQKVEVVEENLRKYFSYWLEMANRKIE